MKSVLKSCFTFKVRQQYVQSETSMSSNTTHRALRWCYRPVPHLRGRASTYVDNLGKIIRGRIRGDGFSEEDQGCEYRLFFTF